MKCRTGTVIAIILLIGCSKENSGLGDKVNSELKEHQTTPHVSGEARKTVEAVVDSSDPPNSSSIAQPSAPIPAHTANPVLPADSAEIIALSLLDQQAETELEGGVLSSTTQLRAQYKSEDRQADWASFVEENLRKHCLNKKFSNVSVVHIGCKTSICELLAVTRDVSSSPSALDAWQKEIYSLPDEHWWQYAQMSQPSFQVSSTKDGRSLFVTHLMRKPK